MHKTRFKPFYSFTFQTCKLSLQSARYFYCLCFQDPRFLWFYPSLSGPAFSGRAFSVPPPNKAESCERWLPRFTECISEIESWMTANRLKMNTDKTDFIRLGSKHQLAKIQSQSIALEAVHVPVSSVVTCLGVQFDSHLTFTPHVQGLACRCFYHLRQLRSVRRSLTTDLAKTLVHALIASRLDYCNCVLY